MIPQAGSAYAYTYATLGELVAWIIGWDLILEYAVGNVAVAISWGDYFTTLLRGVGVNLPAWLTTGYRTALLSAEPGRARRCCRPAPHVAGIPILVNLPAFGIVMAITWLLLRGARESARRTTSWWWSSCAALALFIVVGADAHRHGQLPCRSRRTASPASTRARRSCSSPTSASTRSRRRPRRRCNPQRNLPIGILGGLAICTVIYVVVGAVLTGMVPYQELAKSADPLAYALQAAGLPARRLDRGARRRGLDGGGAAGVPVRAAAHLLLDGARRPAPAVGGEDPPEARASRTSRRCSPASSSRSRRSSATRPRPTT